MGKEWLSEDKATKQLKKALAALDTAVQKWYEYNASSSTCSERYASCHIRTYPSGKHVSSITLLLDRCIDDYVDIASSKDNL